MAPSSSWIDDDELQALGQAAREAAGGPAASAGSRLPAVEPAPDMQPTARPRPEAAPVAPAPAGSGSGPGPAFHTNPPSPSAPASPSASRPSPDAASVETKVELLAGWLRTIFQDRPFFVADREGLPIWAERVEAQQVVMAPALERALRSLRSLQGGLRPTAARLDWEDGRCLEVLWHNTRLGWIAVGVLGAEPLSDAQKRWIVQALEKVFHP